MSYYRVPEVLIKLPKVRFPSKYLHGCVALYAGGPRDLLDEARLRQEGYFYPAPIRQKWAEHVSGQRNWAPHMWFVLMFQAWLEHEGV